MFAIVSYLLLVRSKSKVECFLGAEDSVVGVVSLVSLEADADSPVLRPTSAADEQSLSYFVGDRFEVVYKKYFNMRIIE